MNFTHLHLHSEYSILDGMGTPSVYVKRAKELGFNALGITDHGNIDSFPSFTEACNKQGIKPILGCEAYICKNHLLKDKNRYHINLIVKNAVGFKNLTKLLTIANTDGFYYKPRIDSELLLKYCEGLIVLSACQKSFLISDFGKDLLVNLKNEIGDDIYFEVMSQMPKDYLKALFALQNKYEVKSIPTNDCHYPFKDDAKTHEVLLCMQTQSKMKDPNRWKFDCDDLYLKSEEEMERSFNKENLLFNPFYIDEIIQKVDFKLSRVNPVLPKTIRNDGNDDDFLRAIANEGLAKRRLFLNDKYLKRLQFELEVIKEKGFSGYFLMVFDLMKYCKYADIFVGPGRGSVGGSLLAYCLGITEIDPIKHNLVFERFINKERNDLPDIDLDFEHTKRDKVIAYLQSKYGYDNVCAIKTFIRSMDRGIIRDVARVYDVPLNHVNFFTQQLESLDEDFSWDTSDFVNTYPYVYDSAMRLRGQIKSYGKHAAGIVVSGENLSTSGRCVLSYKDIITMNWEMKDCEFMGFVKLDVLSLSNLTMISHALKLINDKSLILSDIPLDIPDLFDFFCTGETAGIFQFNTKPMINLTRKVNPKSFEDLVAAIALVRPGPSLSGMTDVYIKRKKTGKWDKANKIYEEITKETCGVIAYQEQVMFCVNQLAGMSWQDADKVRKIIGKKRDPKEFDMFKQKFIDGCVEKGTLTEEEARELWEGFEKHASYSFNKSHSVAYAMIAYWCAYLKYKYPKEFFSAALTFSSKTEKEHLIDELKSKNYDFVFPSIEGLRKNKSHPLNWIVEGNQVFIPFSEIKGFGDKAATMLKVKTITTIFGQEISVETTKRNLEIIKDIEKGNYSCYFDFSIPEKKKQFKRQEIVKPEILSFDYEDIFLCGNSFDSYNGKISDLVDKRGIVKSKRGNIDVSSCQNCSLRNEALKPVLSSIGKYNICIVGEAPGKEEDEKGEGFIGRAGKLLWDELLKYGLKKTQFHVMNACKCYPKITKTPNKKHLEICSDHLINEIRGIDSKLILVLGNSPLYSLCDVSGGVMNLSGKMIWSKKVGAFVFVSIHPSSVLRNQDNQEIFSNSIKNFAENVIDLI